MEIRCICHLSYPLISTLVLDSVSPLVILCCEEEVLVHVNPGAHGKGNLLGLCLIRIIPHGEVRKSERRIET